MNWEQQAARIEKIVTTIAERAVSVPPGHRSAYIQDEVEKGVKPSCRPMRLMRG
jgi:hypothetical protein